MAPFLLLYRESTALNCPIIAVQKLIQEIDANHLRGTLIILPISSPGSFLQPNSLQKLTRQRQPKQCLPWKANGTITQKNGALHHPKYHSAK